MILNVVLCLKVSDVQVIRLDEARSITSCKLVFLSIYWWGLSLQNIVIYTKLIYRSLKNFLTLLFQLMKLCCHLKEVTL